MLDQIKSVTKELDEDGDGKVSRHELEDALNDKDGVIARLLAEADMVFPRGFDAEEMFLMMDHSGEQELDHDEFVLSFYRLIDTGPFQQSCLLQSGVGGIKRLLRQCHAELLKRLEVIERRLGVAGRPGGERDVTEDSRDGMLSPTTSAGCLSPKGLEEVRHWSPGSTDRVPWSEMEAALHRLQRLLGEARGGTGRSSATPASRDGTLPDPALQQRPTSLLEQPFRAVRESNNLVDKLSQMREGQAFGDSPAAKIPKAYHGASQEIVVADERAKTSGISL